MILVNCVRGRKADMKIYASIVMTLVVVVISFVGAKILYYLENPMDLLENGFALGGVSFFGSVYLVPVTMIFVCKVAKKSYYAVMDYISPSLMIMLAVLRIGCLVSDCCGGCAVTFAGVYVEKFPTQITECICDLLILAGLLFYERMWKNEGRLYFFIMVYYGIVRFFIEFLRDTPKDWLYMSHGQWFSIISVCVGGYILHKLGKMDRKKNRGKRKR